MKKTILALTTFALLIFVIPAQSIADETEEKKATSEISAEAIAEAKADINNMVHRLLEINEMDIKDMSKEEKKELRNEVRSIKKDMKAYSKSDSEAISEAAAEGAASGGLYISSGAIIIILLLIIIL